MMVAVQTRRWTRFEYDRLIDLGVFGPDDRIELIEGDLVVRSLQNSPHFSGIELGQSELTTAFGQGYEIRAQGPLAISDRSEPEPDIAVVIGSTRDYTRSHPTTALLVVEIADSSLTFDRTTKAAIYAAAGIPEYWIVNLIHRQLEVHRDPDSVPASQGGVGYRTRFILTADDVISPRAAPDARIAVANLLPE